jgi:hypothetical protein
MEIDESNNDSHSPEQIANLGEIRIDIYRVAVIDRQAKPLLRSYVNDLVTASVSEKKVKGRALSHAAKCVFPTHLSPWC